jgi:hypothetical protein
VRTIAPLMVCPALVVVDWGDAVDPAIDPGGRARGPLPTVLSVSGWRMECAAK